MKPQDLLRAVPGRAWASWQRQKLPDEEFRTLLRMVRDDASGVCHQPVTDDYFLDPDRRHRLQAVEEWSHRLSDRRLRRLTANIADCANECWAKTKPPAITDQDPRWTAWQFTAAREWLSATKSAIERVAVLEQRSDKATSRIDPSDAG